MSFPARPGLFQALTSRRVAAVTALSFVSGLPLGVVLRTIPFWLQQQGADIRTIGWITAAQLPYTFKFAWSPLLDAFAPVGARRRSWIAAGQLGLALASVGLCFSSGVFEPRELVLVGMLTLLISFFSATQDIAIDAFSVEVLRPEEQGLAVGARIALYRAAMFVGGSLTVTLGPLVGWRWVFAGLAALYLVFVGITVAAPEPDAPPATPRNLLAAIVEPLKGFFRQPRAWEIAAFLFLYKLSDNLAGALVSPFLGQLGYSAVDVGVASGTVGLVATLVGTFVGGLATQGLGLGRALWLFGILQAVSNLGYAAISEIGVHRLAMYSAMAVEAATTGMGTGAFSVLLLRLTERRFSATQYALFSSLFALGRSVSGPLTGSLVAAMGWRDFFLLTVALSLPGLWMLRRFVPWGSREIPHLVSAGAAGS